MGMVVRTNTMSTNAYRQLGMNNTQLAKSLEKLSSGFRINRAGDDASGLAISEKMKAQIKGLEQASANSQDGISLVQTAEGALTEVHSMLNRMVELATKSANGTIQNDVDRESIQTEVDALNTEISRIAKSTNFNGIQLLDGSLGTGTSGAEVTASTTAAGLATNAINYNVSGDPGLTVQFGSALGSSGLTAAWSGSTLTVTVAAGGAATYKQSDIDAAIANASGAPTAAKEMKVELTKDIAVTAATAVAAGLATGTTAAAKQASVVNAGSGVTVTATKAGAQANTDTLTFEAASSTHSVGSANVVSSGSTTVYLDSTKSYTSSELNDVLSGGAAGMSVSFDGSKTAATLTGAGALALAGGAGLSAGGGITIQVGTTDDSFNKVTVAIDDLTAEGLGIEGLDVSTQTNAGKAIDTIKTAINKVSTNRGNLGALQNRLEYAINNLDTTSENMDAANSRIRDTDMAKEMMNYTKMNILSQAAQSMLAQANQQPQNILKLLQ